MKILGMCPSHDSSAALIEDGYLTRYFKEERLNRVKRSISPRLSIKNCVQDIEYIDILSYCPPTHRWVLRYSERDFSNSYAEWMEYVNSQVSVGSVDDLSRSHHLQHAASSFYNSGFSEAAVIIVDGRGSNFGTIVETETIFLASYPDNFREVYKGYEKTFRFNQEDVEKEKRRLPDCEIAVTSNLGVTHLYCTATHLINQPFLENGKTMGLSAYGDTSKYYEPLLVTGEATVDPSKFVDVELPVEIDSIFEVTFHKDYVNKNRNITKDNYQIYANYAMHVQKETEIALERLVDKAITKTGLKNICLGGGYGLNVVNNYKLTQKFPGVRFFFDPMSDDSGASIGGAMLSYRTHTKDSEMKPLVNNFIHGRHHSLDRISGDKITPLDISKKINDGRIVAIYYGVAEAGPRALGHRSILFDPRIPDGKDIVNKVKRREWYRPFAASMLKDDAEKYFEFTENTGYKYMVLNAVAKPGTKNMFPSIVHVDGSCRIHIVEDEEEPLFKLLTHFKELTGYGVLLNTSFNLAGDPLIETPEEAMGTWKISDIDILWFPEKNIAILK